MTQQHATLLEQVATAAQSLQDQTQQFSGIVTMINSGHDSQFETTDLTVI